MEKYSYFSEGDYTIIDDIDRKIGIDDYCSQMPDDSKSFIFGAKRTLKKIESMLYSAPSFIEIVRAAVPEEAYKAILTGKQKDKIAQGALKLMTKKDGTLMANLVDTKTNRIVSTIGLKGEKITPDISQAITSFAAQMKMAQIAEEIHDVQLIIERVRQGQEHDRLATAYSVKQKLLQAMQIGDTRLREFALLRIAYDAEDSRNLLMLSQQTNLKLLKEQPESIIKKVFNGLSSDEIDKVMKETRENLLAVNMVSLAEAVAYQELNEPIAARQSLIFYANFLQNTYLNDKDFIKRLDSIDEKAYWAKKLTLIKEQINALPMIEQERMIIDGK